MSIQLQKDTAQEENYDDQTSKTKYKIYDDEQPRITQ